MDHLGTLANGRTRIVEKLDRRCWICQMGKNDNNGIRIDTYLLYVSAKIIIIAVSFAYLKSAVKPNDSLTGK